MMIASLLSRHRRVLAWCAASLALHLLALEWIAHRGGSAPGIAVTRGAITARLRSAEPAQTAPQPAVVPVPTPAAAVRPKAVEPALPARAAAGSWAAVSAGDGEPTVQTPRRYQVRLPPAALLQFDVTRAEPGKAPAAAGSGMIEWRPGADSYSLRMAGVAGALNSDGGYGDAGIRPLAASETLADGPRADTTFDEEARQIAFSVSARSQRLAMGSQDRASMLIQLAAIGLAEPDQIRDVIEMFVGGAAEAGVVRFQVMGQEELDSKLGKLATVHLMQLVAPGQTRLDVWLAPQRQWYPVQLRTTTPDGVVHTQLVTRIE